MFRFCSRHRHRVRHQVAGEARRTTQGDGQHGPQELLPLLHLLPRPHQHLQGLGRHLQQPQHRLHPERPGGVAEDPDSVDFGVFHQ